MIQTEILTARDPQWANEERTAINCWVRTNTLAQEVPFTAASYDTEAHGRELYARCLAGEFGEIAPAAPRDVSVPVQQVAMAPKIRRFETFLVEANCENSRRSFRSVVIVWGSFLDNLLDEMLAQAVLQNPAAAQNIGKPPRTFNDRIKKARDAGLIDQDEAEKCQYVRAIRNAAAHEWALSLATEDVLPSLRALHERDHAELSIFHEDLDFLIQQVYSASCAMIAMRFIDRLP